MRRFLSRHFGFRWQDLLRNTMIESTTKFLLETKDWSHKEIENYQIEKLKRLVLHAYNNVRYYKDLFDRHKLDPSSINSLEDLQKIPVLSKEAAKEAGNDLYAKNIIRNIKKGKTGGTTGAPLYLRRDASTRSFTWGAYYRWYRLLGINIGDPIVELWGAPEVLKSRIYSRLKKMFLYYFQNTLVINSFDLNEDTFPHYIKRIVKFKPEVVRGYLSAILTLADYMMKNNIKLDTIKVVTTTSETLYPYYREHLERVFGLRVYNQYGCGECGSIAFEHDDTNELYITREHTVIETIDEKGNQVLNKPGRVILTDLDNYAMVFLRYENGDVATIGSRVNSDGVIQPVLKEILGREKDTIILKNGSPVHGVFFTDIFYELNNKSLNLISRFQVYQNNPGQIIFKIESKVAIPEDSLLLLKSSLEKFFNSVEIKIFDRLPVADSGKFKYIVSDIRNGQNIV